MKDIKWSANKMKDAVRYLDNYMHTYDSQHGYENYNLSIYLDDVIYGLGASISDQYRWASGFSQFKKDLMQYLQETTNEN